ncbi:hypothetical protein SSP35_01_02290 [Streptomyces sp. NBRC 110611]|nr:hypothetical protein SSP35_01_02290 [Streptomyces sp. NBRC 110611]
MPVTLWVPRGRSDPLRDLFDRPLRESPRIPRIPKSSGRQALEAGTLKAGQRRGREEHLADRVALTVLPRGGVLG